MSNLTRRNQEDRTKKYLFVGTTGVGVLSLLFGSTFFGLIGLGMGGYLGWKWLQFRMKNGIRF